VLWRRKKGEQHQRRGTEKKGIQFFKVSPEGNRLSEKGLNLKKAILSLIQKKKDDTEGEGKPLKNYQEHATIHVYIRRCLQE